MSEGRPDPSGPARPAAPSGTGARGPGALPSWLGGDGAARRRERRRAIESALAGVLLLGGGVVVGWLVHEPPPVAPVAVPACRDPLPCVEHVPGSPHEIAGHRPPAPLRRAKGAGSPTLSPLPDAPPLDEDARKALLRAFAQKKAPDLRACVREPDKGPQRKVGAAFEIDDHGAVAAVQLVGTENIPAGAARCYRERMKAWQFPRDLLRGDESMLVSFVF